MGARTRQARVSPGFHKCPTCRHIVDSKDMVECIRENKSKGKKVCLECGIAWLKTHDKIPPTHKGPVQSKGQQQMRME